MIWKGISKTGPTGQWSYLVLSGQRQSDAPDAKESCLLAALVRRAHDDAEAGPFWARANFIKSATRIRVAIALACPDSEVLGAIVLGFTLAPT